MMQTHTSQVNSPTNTQSSGSVSIRYDPSYLHTLPGRLKITELVLNVVGFIFVVASIISHHGRCSWFNTVAMIGFWTTGILLTFYVFHIVEKFNRIPWLKIEFIFCAIETVGYLLASALIAALASSSESLGVAAFVGFISMCVYGFDCWEKFKAMRNGDWPQGQKPSCKPVSTISSSTAY
ncbi:CKLF-like MARVEL transmembrane domain-containing protein 4 [Copidosoma floridanum]|uniref:CKLF-like MARVEL transmembrane domain-containing protein 4 n=1 Tax=Copidosoma floridanum TaxID=29053 RepID=UPI0006C96D08|nr:CKLF-like MARVEL transmembrane domain-containing protein 4 [Copidosoma floridanum]XP_014203318.1 CKLF-like MARVEL transmembrane domain-containing protein 4 [Copidosoma floridanum]XP_014203328.1 CKLF-like MARVEL transmembrane domain-containing protein 4 [Copidosoma floridanum]XP_014203337.1 CKLF-like MARVEL transmembrane domain-containing protein 4 [Copidosoma floridanum]